MATEPKKTESPPYVSYATFANLIKGLRATGIPSRIDKSVLSKLSGSVQGAVLSALKWLGLIDADGVPSAKLEALVAADEATYPTVLSDLLRSRYSFVADGSLNLAKATGSQVEQKFREYGISGSTVVKCMGFFIAAAREAKMALGPHVKAPKQPPSNGPRKSRIKPGEDEAGSVDKDESDPSKPPEKLAGFVRIQIPLHNMDDGAIFLPDGLTKSQWAYALKITKFLLDNYRPDEGEAAGGGSS